MTIRVFVVRALLICFGAAGVAKGADINAFHYKFKVDSFPHFLKAGYWLALCDTKAEVLDSLADERRINRNASRYLVTVSAGYDNAGTFDARTTMAFETKQHDERALLSDVPISARGIVEAGLARSKRSLALKHIDLNPLERVELSVVKVFTGSRSAPRLYVDFYFG